MLGPMVGSSRLLSPQQRYSQPPTTRDTLKVAGIDKVHMCMTLM